MTAGVSIDRAARLMEAHRIHRLVVTADDGETPIGVLSVSDLVHSSREAAGMTGELGVHELAAPDRKVAGEAKELHESRLSGATTVLDIHTYVDDFNGVVDAYRRGVADAELPSESGVARSVIPPGTAAARDFSGLAPRIPEFLLDACVGCMTCVNACPDTAIGGVAGGGGGAAEEGKDGLLAVKPSNSLSTRPSGRSSRASPTQTMPRRARGPLRPHDQVRGGAGAPWPGARAVRHLRGPIHCKGCSECVEVCHALGYDALRMVDKAPVEASGESTVERYARDLRLLRSLGPHRRSTGTRRRSRT